MSLWSVITETWDGFYKYLTLDDMATPTTNQRLEAIKEGQAQILAQGRHNHDLLHLILLRQGVTKEQINQLLAARSDTAEWSKLIATLAQPTDALAAEVKKNQ